MSAAAAFGPGTVVGFIGLGKMGAEMSTRLYAAGYQVRGYDVSAEARAAFAEATGGPAVEHVSEVADGAACVILMLPTSAIVSKVLLEDGLLAAMAAGSTLIDMGSSQPESTQELAALAAKRDVQVLDAPVSGGVRGAKAGTLTIMTGGPEPELARCRPLLGVLGKSVVRAGDVGAGHALKAINNLLSASHLLASSEALYIGTRFGLDPQVMLDGINGSSGKSWSTEMKLPTYVLPQSFTSGFALRLLVKDTRIAVELAHAVGQPVPHAEATLALWAAAAEALPADADHTEIARWVADRTAPATA